MVRQTRRGGGGSTHAPRTPVAKVCGVQLDTPSSSPELAKTLPCASPPPNPPLSIFKEEGGGGGIVGSSSVFTQYRYIAERTTSIGDDFMGRLFYPIRSIPTAGEERMFTLLSHKEKKQYGSVTIRLHIKPVKEPLEVFVCVCVRVCVCLNTCDCQYWVYALE